MMVQRKRAVAFVLATITLDMVALGIIAPVLPQLILRFLHGQMSHAAEIGGLFAAVFALMQLIFSPILGILSDRFGRKPVIVLSNIGLGLDYFIMAFSPTLIWLLAGRIISGITSSSITTVYAYITDVTEPEKRAAAFGLVGASFGVGFIIGPFLGGVFGAIDPRLPFVIAGALSLVNGLYGYFILPESLPPERRTTSIGWKRAHPFGSLRLLRSHPELFQLASINFIGYIAHEVFSIWVLYTIFRYAWNTRAIGLSLALVGVTSVFVSAVLVGRVVARIGERGALIWGLVFGTAGMFVLGWASSGWTAMIAILLLSLWGLYGAPAQSLMTQRVSGGEQGELQGALGSIRSITMIGGPPLFAFLFAAGVNVRIPGAPWYLAAALIALSLLLAFRVPRESSAPVLATEPHGA
ncbi:MAG: TCR/Tet family MFS transporter [Candidatus Eremiobacteraeota bacterium]|nr:TCR/Tet family MFS transporter [Candidatus Eremiobacteraeota bacterium]